MKENGRKVNNEIYYWDYKNVKNGEFKYYNEDGSLDHTDLYEKGKTITGNDQRWIDKKTYEGRLVNLKKNGEWKTVGKEEMEILTFSDDIKNGEARTYYSSGSLKSLCYYKDDKLHGKWTEYFENGSLLLEKTYFNDELSGICRIYHVNGKIAEELNYVNNYLNGDFYSYDSAGKIYRSFSFRKHVLCGEARIYYDYKKNIVKTRFVFDRFKGNIEYTEYYKNGIDVSSRGQAFRKIVISYNWDPKEINNFFIFNYDFEKNYEKNGYIVKHYISEYFSESGELERRENYFDGILLKVTDIKNGDVVKEEIVSDKYIIQKDNDTGKISYLKNPKYTENQEYHLLTGDEESFKAYISGK